MKNKRLIILIVLGIAAFLSLLYGITAPTRGKRKAPPVPETVCQGETAQPAKGIVPAKRRAKKTDFSLWGRNPFAAKTADRKKPSNLILSGIVWHKERPRAIINGTMVGIGDEIGGNTVVDIEQDHVVLDTGTERVILKLQ